MSAPSQKRTKSEKANGKVQKAGEVRLDNENPDKMGWRTRSNHHNMAVRRLQRRNYANGGEYSVLSGSI